MQEGYQVIWQRRTVQWTVLLSTILLLLTGCGLKEKTTSDTSSSSTDLTSADTISDTSSTDTTSTTPDSTTDTTLVTNDITTALPTEAQASLDIHLAQAKAAASAWKTDATLSYVSVELPASLAPDNGNEVYVFGSAEDASSWWTYSISQATGKFVRALIPKDDYLGTGLIPVNEKYWKMNYVEAFQLADKNGGSAFRQTNPGTRVSVFLSQREPKGWLWWTVEYKAPSSQTFTLLVNPNLGDVTDENGTPVSGAATYDTTTATPSSSSSF